MQRHLKLIYDITRGKPFKLRSPKWHQVEKEHLKKEPECRWCGATVGLQVHHVRPFHLHPELELEPSNLITLCEEGGYLNCHLIHGHLGGFQNFNPDVRAQCDERRKGHEWVLLQAIRKQDPDLYEWITNSRKIERKKHAG